MLYRSCSEPKWVELCIKVLHSTYPLSSLTLLLSTSRSQGKCWKLLSSLWKKKVKDNLPFCSSLSPSLSPSPPLPSSLWNSQIRDQNMRRQTEVPRKKKIPELSFRNFYFWNTSSFHYILKILPPLKSLNSWMSFGNNPQNPTSHWTNVETFSFRGSYGTLKGKTRKLWRKQVKASTHQSITEKWVQLLEC